MPASLQAILRKFRRAVAGHEQASRDAQLSRPPGKLDGRVITVFLVGAVILSLLNYYGGSSAWDAMEIFVAPFSDDPEARVAGWFTEGDFARLARLAYWSGTSVVGYFVIPVLIIVLVWRDRLSDYGLPFPGSNTPFGICIGFFLIMLPLVFIVSFTDSFQSAYPFYEHSDRSAFDFLAWQLLYAAQFFALEFFYRGFLIHGLKRRLGIYAIFVSMIPYVMIHFGKPMPETFGSIIAGLALGALSYHYRSIWPGVFLHIAVAFSMDVFSLSAQGRIGLF